MFKSKSFSHCAAIGLTLSAMSAQATVVASDNFTEDTPGTSPGLHPTDSDSPWTLLQFTGPGTGSTALVQQAATASDPFGAAGNNYLAITSPAVSDGLNLRSSGRFDLGLLTISFDVHEPGDGGDGDFNIQLYDGVTNVYSVAIDNGSIGAHAAYTVDTDAHVDMIVNATGTNVTHLDQTIGDGSLGLWVDGAYVGNIGGFAAASGASVDQLRLTIFNNEVQTLLIDNFQINDEAVVIPEPGSLVMLLAGALAVGGTCRIRS